MYLVIRIRLLGQPNQVVFLLGLIEAELIDIDSRLATLEHPEVTVIDLDIELGMNVAEKAEVFLDGGQVILKIVVVVEVGGVIENDLFDDLLVHSLDMFIKTFDNF